MKGWVWFLLIGVVSVTSQCVGPIDFSSTDPSDTRESPTICNNQGMCVNNACRCNATWFGPLCNHRCYGTLPDGYICDPGMLRFYPCPYNATLGYRVCPSNSSLNFCGRDSSPEYTYGRPYAYNDDTQTAILCWTANTAYRYCVDNAVICSGSPCLNTGICECTPAQSGLACEFPNCMEPGGNGMVCSGHGFCFANIGCDCFRHHFGRFCQFVVEEPNSDLAIPFIIMLVVIIVGLAVLIVICLALVNCCTCSKK